MKKKLRVRWSCEEMTKGGRRLRFLTLTVRECGLPLGEVVERFRALRNSRYMREALKGNQYICVYEKHPNGHGWHIHMVINFYLNITEFRCWAVRYGFGRLHIELCTEEIGRYISKYISKSLENRPEECKGLRMINVSRGLCAMRDIVVSSPSIDFIRRNMNVPSLLKFPLYRRIKLLKRTWTFRLLPQEMCHSLDYLNAEFGLLYF